MGLALRLFSRLFDGLLFGLLYVLTHSLLARAHAFKEQRSFYTSHFHNPCDLLGHFLWSNSNGKCSSVAGLAAHSGMEMARCLSKCQNGKMRCTLALSHRVSQGFNTHTKTHAGTHLHHKVTTINAESNPIRDRVRLGESN